MRVFLELKRTIDGLIIGGGASYRAATADIFTMDVENIYWEAL
ncbi:hypothetical protein [Paenibacillus periandrae]|nr:hypothetical protein [Paenibacillus periandrae]